MPDHGHTLIWPSYPLLISSVRHDIKQGSARKLYTGRGSEGPHWQHRLRDRYVRHKREFRARLDTLNLNPVRKPKAHGQK